MKGAILISIFFLIGCEQTRVDEQLEELCKKDGGAKIYEKVVLPKEQFTKYGDPVFHKTWNMPGGGYQFLSEHDRIKAEKPTLTRYSYSVIREADNKLLGTYVVYSRIGGDIMWRPGPDSSKSCPSRANDTEFIRAIFVNEAAGNHQ